MAWSDRSSVNDCGGLITVRAYYSVARLASVAPWRATGVASGAVLAGSILAGVRMWSTGLAVFWAASVLAIHVQAQTARISGTVVDIADHVLPGTEVTLAVVSRGSPALDAPVGPVFASTVASEMGRFEFPSVPAGLYVIAAQRSGYAPGIHGPVEVGPGSNHCHSA